MVLHTPEVAVTRNLEALLAGYHGDGQESGEDYQSDERFLHRGWIDDAVAGERIRAILGVPLVLDGRVIGALLAVHRSVRRFPASEVHLLTSFAAHAVLGSTRTISA